MEEFIDLFGNKKTVYSRKDWTELFVNRCQKLYNKYSDSNGTFACGYHWCCDECKLERVCGCRDCVETIITILEKNNIEIDYNNLDFDYWEKLARDLYERK